MSGFFAECRCVLVLNLMKGLSVWLNNKKGEVTGFSSTPNICFYLFLLFVSSCESHYTIWFMINNFRVQSGRSSPHPNSSYAQTLLETTPSAFSLSFIYDHAGYAICDLRIISFYRINKNYLTDHQMFLMSDK